MNRVFRSVLQSKCLLLFIAQQLASTAVIFLIRCSCSSASVTIARKNVDLIKLKSLVLSLFQIVISLCVDIVFFSYFYYYLCSKMNFCIYFLLFVSFVVLYNLKAKNALKRIANVKSEHDYFNASCDFFFLTLLFFFSSLSLLILFL